MWFKNINIFKVTQAEHFDGIDLEQALAEKKYRECGQNEQKTYGWCPVINDGKNFVHGINNNKMMLLRAKKETREVPADLIKKMVVERIKPIEEEQLRTVSKREKEQIKEDIIFELLPRAFPKYSDTYLYIDQEREVIVVDASSRGEAEDALALLRSSLGSLPVTSYLDDYLVGDVLSNWVMDKTSIPELFTPGETVKIVGDSSKITIENDDIFTEMVTKMIAEEGRVVEYLHLDFDDAFSFMLTEKGMVKRVNFNDVITEQNADIDTEDVASLMDADFALMSGEFGRFIDELKKAGLVESADKE